MTTKPEKKTESEATVRAYATLRDTQGWRLIVCDIPESLLTKHAIEISEPDPLSLVLEKIEYRIRAAIQ